MPLPSGYWRDLTTEDFAETDPERTVALLPLAAIEQHGPHLPVYTDACIAEGIIEATFNYLDDDASLLVLPMIAMGTSCEHQDFAGTLGARPETLIAYCYDIAAGVARAGLRKIILFNTHGGQPQVVDLVALKLRRDFQMLAVRATYFAFGVPDGLFDEEELDHGLHGGAVETSIMLHLRPDLVRQEVAENFEPISIQMQQDYRHLRAEGGAAGFAWLAQDLHPAGVTGNAALADAARGRRVLEYAAKTLAELVADTARFPLSQLREGPQE